MAGVGRLVKETIIRDATEDFKKQPNLIITSLSRLPASEANTLRRQLNHSQARLVMIKRSLGLRAISEFKVTGLEALLEGTIGFVLPGEDVLLTAKALVEFGKTHEEQVTIRGGLIDGLLLDTKAIKALADLPPRPVLLAQVLGTLEAPIADVIFTLERLIGDIAWLAEEASKAKPQAAAPAPVQASAPAAQPQAEAKPQAEPPLAAGA